MRRAIRKYLIVSFAALAAIVSCWGQFAQRGSIEGFVFDNSGAVIAGANLTLTDQNGKNVSLASLKGKPALFDFIYTSCPGPCLMLTSRMRLIANRLGPLLGSKVWFVSVTVDPEHDGPGELLNYAKQQGADHDGWLFLTGSPADIEQLMNQFKLVRQREADGTVDHVLEFFLVGPDGRQLYQYAASHAEPALVSSDIRQAAETGSASAEGHARWKVHL